MSDAGTEAATAAAGAGEDVDQTYADALDDATAAVEQRAATVIRSRLEDEPTGR